MKAYIFKLYHSKRNKYLDRKINLAGAIYNHLLALHRRYYRMFGKSVGVELAALKETQNTEPPIRRWKAGSNPPDGVYLIARRLVTDSDGSKSLVPLDDMVCGSIYLKSIFNHGRALYEFSEMEEM
jgi:hypothetical protein